MSYGETDYIHIADWMWARKGLGLKIGSIELALFARIHGFSRRGAGVYYELQQSVADLFEVSREAINRSMRALVEKGCVAEIGTRRLRSGRSVKVYTTHTEKVVRAMASYAATSTGIQGAEKSQIAPSNENSSQQISPISDDPSQGPRRDDSSHEGNCIDDGDFLKALNCGYANSDSPFSLKGGASDHSSHVAVSHTDSKGSIKPPQSLRTETVLVAKQLAPEDEVAFATLCKKSLKPVWVTTEDDARTAFTAALAKGYTSEQIVKAYDRYITRYRNDNPDTPRYAKRLDAWLSEPNGLAWDAPKPRKLRKGPQAPSAPSEDEMRERLAAIDPEYQRLRSSHIEACSQVVFAHGQHLTEEETDRLKEIAGRKLVEAEEYFDSHKQAVM